MELFVKVVIIRIEEKTSPLKKQRVFHIINQKLIMTTTLSVSYKDHRHVIIGPSNVGETYYMLKILEKVGNKRPIHLIS